MILGLGNFAHRLGYSYRLDAVDTSNAAMPLSGFTQLGSYAHTWTIAGGSFADQLALNTATHLFDVSTANGFNADILLFSLPANVREIVVSTVGGAGGDTVNVLLGTVPQSVPEPSTVPLVPVTVALLFAGAARRRAG